MIEPSNDHPLNVKQVILALIERAFAKKIATDLYAGGRATG